MNGGVGKIPREREAGLCPCKSRASYADCCMPFHYGRSSPETALLLMRARYEYFIKGERNELHGKSRFKRFKGQWKYLDDKG